VAIAVDEDAILKKMLRTGKRRRLKTAVKGKRFRGAGCRKRSPKPVKTPAPWYCPNCLRVEGNWLPSGADNMAKLYRYVGAARWPARLSTRSISTK
jgi:hypothetical protein